MSKPQDSPSSEQALVANRYQLHRSIGEGGAAVVYEATDQQTGQRLALKRLRPQNEGGSAVHLTELFEREFHTLCQLAHPRIVQVYDYALDAEGPYYTMELLDGGDLQQLAPLPWRRVCAVGRDICSALSLLHSRRMVHRDVSTRNVRCTEDGLAKLIDFGAMVRMGPVKQFVGTPPFCAPEVVECRPLDGRADLFALGAALYYALVGRHAYPVRALAQLFDLWRVPVVPPSERVAEIPPELDDLVLRLLSPDRNMRPASAGEVMERLSAIDGVAVDDGSPVAQAYLSTPSLVGRDQPLAWVKRRLERTRRKRGRAVVVDGASGVGRSRFLDACALEARFLGLNVLRLDADDARAGDYGVVRALARQLLRIRPAATVEAARPNLDRLAHVVPELAEQDSGAPPKPGGETPTRGVVQTALRQWFLEVVHEAPTLLVIDDVHRMDEPSVAFIVLLAQEIEGHPLAMLVSNETGASATAPAALEWMYKRAKRITLGMLNEHTTRDLLGSVFGDVPHLELLARRLHTVSAGNPRDMLRLAQHLVDRGVLHYQGGVWSLPSRLDPSDLPESIAQALRMRLDTLSAGAKALGRAFAMRPELSFSLEDCLLLSGHTDRARLQGELDELLRCEVLKPSGEGFALSHTSWVDPLREDAQQEDRALHRGLASLFEQGGRDVFRAAQHRLWADDVETGLDLLVAHAVESLKITTHDAAAFIDLVLSMPDDWFDTYDRGIRLCEALNRPPWQAFELRIRLSGLVSATGFRGRAHVTAMLEQLSRFAGLEDWARLDAGMDPMARIGQALALAQQRFDQTPEHERVRAPQEAIGKLTSSLIEVASTNAGILDVPYLLKLPSLEPLVPLSPAVAVIHALLQGLIARLQGKQEARAIYQGILDRTAQPDRAGLGSTHHTYLRLGLNSSLGMLEASLGLNRCLERAAYCEQDPIYRLNGLQVRALHHLWQGDVRTALKYRKEIEFLRIQNGGRSFLEGTHLTWQISAEGLCDDLIRIKESLQAIEPLAAQHAGWQPVRSYGLGELHRIRGEHERALECLERAMSQCGPGTHLMWVSIAGAQLRTLNACARHQEVRKRGLAYLEAAEQAGLGDHLHFIRMPLAVALAGLGDPEAAAAHVDRMFIEIEALQATGIVVGLAHETAARVALERKDWERAQHALERCRYFFAAHDNSALGSKLSRLQRALERAQRGTRGEDLGLDGEERRNTTERVHALDEFDSTQARAAYVLSRLAEASGTRRGVLYVWADGAMIRRAELDIEGDPSAFDTLVTQLTRSRLERTEQTITGDDADEESSLHEALKVEGGRYVPVMLQHPTDLGETVTGVALLWAPDDAGFDYPARLATHLSRRLHELGDVSAFTMG